MTIVTYIVKETFPIDTIRRTNVNSLPILHMDNFCICFMLQMKYRRFFVSFRRTLFYVISISEKSTSFWSSLVDVISMSKKSTLSRSTLFDVIWIGKKSTMFWRALFDLILMEKETMWLRNTLFDVISMVKQLSLFQCPFFEVFLIDKRLKSSQYAVLMQFWWVENWLNSYMLFVMRF